MERCVLEVRVGARFRVGGELERVLRGYVDGANLLDEFLYDESQRP